MIEFYAVLEPSSSTDLIMLFNDKPVRKWSESLNKWVWTGAHIGFIHNYAVSESDLKLLETPQKLKFILSKNETSLYSKN